MIYLYYGIAIAVILAIAGTVYFTLWKKKGKSTEVPAEAAPEEEEERPRNVVGILTAPSGRINPAARPAAAQRTTAPPARPAPAPRRAAPAERPSAPQARPVAQTRPVSQPRPVAQSPAAKAPAPKPVQRAPKKEKAPERMPPMVPEISSLLEEDKTRLMNAAWYRCENPYCNYTQFLDVHHIVPEAGGGTNKLDNLIVLCPRCHNLADNNEIPEGELRSWIGNRSERFSADLDWPYR